MQIWGKLKGSERSIGLALARKNAVYMKAEISDPLPESFVQQQFRLRTLMISAVICLIVIMQLDQVLDHAYMSWLACVISRFAPFAQFALSRTRRAALT